MRRIAIIAVLFILKAVPAEALDDSDIINCASIVDNLARLQCFDGIVAAAGLSPLYKTVSTPGVGKWHTAESLNPLDDTKTIALSLVSENGASNRWGGSISLIARCQSNVVDVYIDWGEYLGDKATPTVRVDDKTAEAQQWSVSTDSQATFHPRGRVFLQELESASRLVMQITPYNESPRTPIFDLSGLDEATKPLWDACGGSSPTQTKTRTAPIAPITPISSPAPQSEPFTEQTILVKPASLMCATSTTYNSAIQIERLAASREQADYGPQCFLFYGSDRKFEQMRISGGATIVRRSGVSLYTANENIER